ncbi:hypothetical protein GQ54DRAFT_334203 [Martensiomyces pterosporus]|nr:hypothetical protein GQ54DRAFT_334203 [Martensiomyces pterosporus]
MISTENPFTGGLACPPDDPVAALDQGGMQTAPAAQIAPDSLLEAKIEKMKETLRQAGYSEEDIEEMSMNKKIDQGTESRDAAKVACEMEKISVEHRKAAEEADQERARYEKELDKFKHTEEGIAKEKERLDKVLKDERERFKAQQRTWLQAEKKLHDCVERQKALLNKTNEVYRNVQNQGRYRDILLKEREKARQEQAGAQTQSYAWKVATGRKSGAMQTQQREEHQGRPAAPARHVEPLSAEERERAAEKFPLPPFIQEKDVATLLVVDNIGGGLSQTTGSIRRSLQNATGAEIHIRWIERTGPSSVEIVTRVSEWSSLCAYLARSRFSIRTSLSPADPRPSGPVAPEKALKEARARWSSWTHQFEHSMMARLGSELLERYAEAEQVMEAVPRRIAQSHASEEGEIEDKSLAALVGTRRPTRSLSEDAQSSGDEDQGAPTALPPITGQTSSRRRNAISVEPVEGSSSTDTDPAEETRVPHGQTTKEVDTGDEEEEEDSNLEDDWTEESGDDMEGMDLDAQVPKQRKEVAVQPTGWNAIKMTNTRGPPLPRPPQEEPPAEPTTVDPEEWRQSMSLSPGWATPHPASCIIGCVNANGIIHTHHIDALGQVCQGMAADILAVTETHWQAEEIKNKEVALRRKYRLHLRATTHPAGTRQKGVALLLSDRISQRQHRVDTAHGPENTELGTAIRLSLAFRRYKIHIIAVYRPPGPENRSIRKETDAIVQKWLTNAQRKRAGVVLLGSLNEQLWVSATDHSAIGQQLKEHYQDAWRAVHGDLPGYTYERRDTYSTLDYIFVKGRLRDMVRQIAIMTEESPLGEDHRQVWAEIGGMAFSRKPARIPLQRQPRIAAEAAPNEQRDLLTRKAEQKAGSEEPLEEVIYQAAKEALPSKAQIRAWTRWNLKLHRASDLGKRLAHQVCKGQAQQHQWMKLMQEADSLLPDGAPQQVMQKARELVAEEGASRQSWMRQAKQATNNTVRRLQQLVRTEAKKRKVRSMNKAVQRRFQRFESNPGCPAQPPSRTPLRSTGPGSPNRSRDGPDDYLDDLPSRAPGHRPAAQAMQRGAGGEGDASELGRCSGHLNPQEAHDRRAAE